MSYVREIPRDLFNEASLLKCLGQLCLKCERLQGLSLPEGPFQSFDIVQDPSDGSICARNLPLSAGGRQYLLARPLNSRRPWPLYAVLQDDDDFDPIAVFDDEGALTREFLSLA